MKLDKNLNVELSKNLCLLSYASNGKRCRNSKGRLSKSEIMTILVCYHFGTYRILRSIIRIVSVAGSSMNSLVRCFIELMSRVFFKMLLFMKLYAFGKCTGITSVDSTMIPVCHNVRRYFNKVFAGLAKNGKGYGLLLWI